MAIYNLRVSSSKGRSVVFKFNYITRNENFSWEKDKKYDDFIFAESVNMPDFAKNNPSLFWNSVENYERNNSNDFREIEFTLPHELTIEEIISGLKKIAKNENVLVTDEAFNFMAISSSGDFRSAINLLDIAISCSENKEITLDLLKTINSKPVFFFDKNEDGHYDVLSALQKSIRGSDVDASLHYLARLIEAEDLDSIYRRLSVIAYEDIGLANPSIGPKVMAAINAAELVGLPEARIPLATLVCEMALSPKSNSAHVALDLALNDIRTGNTGNVPDHIKTNSKTYKYPPNYPNSWVKQQYLPDKIKNKKYYTPRHNKYEDNLYYGLESIKKNKTN